MTIYRQQRTRNEGLLSVSLRTVKPWQKSLAVQLPSEADGLEAPCIQSLNNLNSDLNN